MILLLIFLFVSPLFSFDLLLSDHFGVKNLVFAEDETKIVSSADWLLDYDISCWSAGVYSPFGRYKLYPYVSSLKSEDYYSETIVSLNNSFKLYEAEKFSLYGMLIPRLIVRSYGKLAETGDPVFAKGLSKVTVDAGVLVKYSPIVCFFYSTNINRPNLGVLSESLLQPETGCGFGYTWCFLTLGVEVNSVSYSSFLIFNYPSFFQLYLAKSKEMYSYGFGLKIKNVFFGFRNFVYEFSLKPQVFLEYNL